MEPFLSRLKQLRCERGVSQEAMAAQLEISYSAYKRYESGEREPGIWLVAKMADYFNVSIDYLVGRAK